MENMNTGHNNFHEKKKIQNHDVLPNNKNGRRQ